MPTGKKIANLCRFCGSTASKKTERPKNKFKDDFERYFGINSEKCSGRLNALVTQEQCLSKKGWPLIPCKV